MFRVFSMTMFVVALAIWASGCGPAPTHEEPSESHAEHQHEEEGHVHSDAELGPHGGHLVELGDCQYHAELLHDDETNKVSVYLWDAEVKQPVEADASEITLQLFSDGQFVDYTLAAVPDQSGQSTVSFELVDPALSEVLSQAESLRGRLTASIGGEKYMGDVEHTAHDHAEHGHEGEASHDHKGHDHEGEADDEHEDHDQTEH